MPLALTALDVSSASESFTPATSRAGGITLTPLFHHCVSQCIGTCFIITVSVYLSLPGSGQQEAVKLFLSLAYTSNMSVVLSSFLALW